MGKQKVTEESDNKELVVKDEKKILKIFCMASKKQKRDLIMMFAVLVGLLVLMVLFAAYAGLTVFQEDTTSVKKIAQLPKEFTVTWAAYKENLLRDKRETNGIPKLSENDPDEEKNVIKRDTDYESMERFLNEKFKEMNRNEASDEKEIFIQKRSGDLTNSIQNLEKTIIANQVLVKSLMDYAESEETANLIAKDIDDVSFEIKALDDDIVGIMETAWLANGANHKRVRHKRETEVESKDIDPVAIRIFIPILEEKKREKRLVQEKLAEVRDEFIRCKKAANGEDAKNCDGIYSKVMEKFRIITKKFREIEKIVDEMEHFHPSHKSSSEEASNWKKKKTTIQPEVITEPPTSTATEVNNKMTTVVGPEKEAIDLPLHLPTNAIRNPAWLENMPPHEFPHDQAFSFKTLDESQQQELQKGSKLNPEWLKDLPVNPASNAPVLKEENRADLPAEFGGIQVRNFDDFETATADSASVTLKDNVWSHPRFHEDIEDSHANNKPFQNHHTLNQIISKKFESGPGGDGLFELIVDNDSVDDRNPAWPEYMPPQNFPYDHSLNDDSKRHENEQGARRKPEKLAQLPTQSADDIGSQTTESCFIESGSVTLKDNIWAHPRFQEDIDDSHANLKLFQNHHSVDQLVSRKIERSQRGPGGGGGIAELLEDIVVIADGVRNMMEESGLARNAGKDKPNVAKAPESEIPKEDIIGATGPFMALCEQMTKQQKEAQQAQQPQQQFQSQAFEPHTIPLSTFGGQFAHVPATAETMKATSKVVINPGYSMMPYPVCFVNYPQYRAAPLMYMPVTQPGGKYQNTHSQHDLIDPEFIRSSGGFVVPTAANYQRPLQTPLATYPGYREAKEEVTQPTYCTFLASNNGDVPTHYSETTEQPARRFPAENTREQSDESERSEDKSRARAFNIPNQYDIIYATYPNYMFAVNQSAHHHCDEGKISCFNSHQCITKSKWCDSKVDCLDASDETACSCKSRLNEERICDGVIDCPMGSDELGCFGCDRFQYSCYSSRKEFDQSGKVSSLMCYSSIEKCDGFNNCRNGKDESECSMLVRNVGAMLSYTVSSSEGILHHNLKGRWYPVCMNSNRWAIEACEMELGKLEAHPFISIKSMQVPGPFLQPNNSPNGPPVFTDHCKLEKEDNEADNHAVFVKCPPPLCGSSKLRDLGHIDIELGPRGRNSDNETVADARIVGGVDAEAMEFPFIVSIYKDGNFHCGGSIFNEHWILTAAHCTRAFQSHYFEIWAGLLRRSSFSPSVQISGVSHVIRHENYDQSTMRHDIALMKVRQPLTFNRWVRPICLPSKGKTTLGDDWKQGPKAGTVCSAIGWGALREKGPNPDNLKVVDVPIMAKCKYSYDQETESVCAGETFGTRDACQGDSGGPLVCKSLNNPSQLYLLGIVSHGEGCARANEPGVYTRMALHLDWINENTVDSNSMSESQPRTTCPGEVCVWGGRKCISKSQKCDGFVDCLGGEDEIECTINWLDLLLGSNNTEALPPTATNSSIDPTNFEKPETKNVTKKDTSVSFRCTRIPQVINLDQRCDKHFDCEDATDEANCSCRDYLSTSYPKLICNGYVDCVDSTDEKDCLKCKAPEFACPHSKTCIEKSLRCDGKFDCKFREDESECFALTDGLSVILDVNGKPFMHTKGIVTKNVNSTWQLLCDTKDEFKQNGGDISADVCNLIGFKSVKSWDIISLPSSKVSVTNLDPSATNIRSAVTKSQIPIEPNNCVGLEVECLAIQSSLFATHPIQQANIRKNSTSVISPKIEVFFVPLNATDHKSVVVKPAEQKNETDLEHLHDIDWPWSAEVFVNGEITANGILLDKSWVLVDRQSLNGDDEPLRENHVVVLLGNKNSQWKVRHPYEQTSRVDCLRVVNDSDVVMLHLQSPVEFNRHVLPSFLPLANETLPDVQCLAIALGSNRATKTLGLKVITNCSSSDNLICYQQNSNSTKCDSEIPHQTALIVCKSKISGWYPKAFNHLENGFCDFQEQKSFQDLKSVYEQIRGVIDHKKCENKTEAINCETYRCPLGKCLEKSQLCNGRIDCHDGSDESDETCKKLPKDTTVCTPTEFSCLNGKCIDKSKFCDHVNDCADRSDEPSECTCFSYIRATDPGKLCDGIRHCWDRTDENPNYCGANCSASSFKCGGSIFCVPEEMVCDKRNDCPNGADEEFCHGIYNYDTIDGYGEVMEKTFGIWHTKCFPKETPPTQEELEALCKKLGFKDTTKVSARVTGSQVSEKSNPAIKEISVEFKSFNATKVLPYSKFSAVQINDGFTVHLRPSQPLAKLVLWDKTDHENCHRMDLKCSTE